MIGEGGRTDGEAFRSNAVQSTSTRWLEEDSEDDGNRETEESVRG